MKRLERTWEDLKRLERWEGDRHSDRLTRPVLERHAPLKTGIVLFNRNPKFG